MKSVYNFVVKPLGKRYNNTKKIGDTKLILNTELYNHEFVNREATVVSLPIINKTNIKVGDVVTVHHNVFRRWHNIKGIEKNSKSYFNENTYVISEDQIFLYKSKGKYKCLDGYCFVKPIKSTNKLNSKIEKPLVGIVKYTDGLVEKNSMIGFRPDSEYEFIVNGEKLYRILSNFITIKYEYQGDEEEYNPSWAQGG